MIFKQYKILLGLVIALTVSSANAENISIVAENDWYPYSADRGGKADGFAVDVVSAAFKSMGVDVNFKVMPYARGLDETKKGTELAVFNTTKTTNNENDYLWPKNSLFSAAIVLYAPASSNESGLSVKDVEGKTVGITNGYEYGTAFDTNKNIKKDAAVDDKTMMRKLAAGRTQYGAIYEKVAKVVISENKGDLEGKVKQVGVITSDNLFVAFSKSHKDGAKYRDLLDKGLEKIRASGEYKKIEEKWDKKF